MSNDSQAAAVQPRFQQLPVALFGSVMGLTGLSVVWHTLHEDYATPRRIAEVIAWIALTVFALLAVAYGVKLATARAAVRAEFDHPVMLNLFGTFWISLLLLPIVLAPLHLPLARLLWVVGAVGMTSLAGYVVSRWLSVRQAFKHATPPWFVPVVGLLDIPLALPVLELPQWHAVAVAALAIGLFFAIPLFTLVFARLALEEPMPESLQPTILILTAPSAVGMSSYVSTIGEVDLFARSLFWITIFVLAVTVGRLRHLRRCCPFRLAWWAVSFPLAGCAVAGLRYARAEPSWFAHALAMLLVALATGVIAVLLVRSITGIARGELRELALSDRPTRHASG